jgi:iron complex outermembrane receptor protein
VFPIAGIDAYSELDLRVGWQVSDSWSLSLLGQNLLHDEHAEFGTAQRGGRFERAASIEAAWRN